MSSMSTNVFASFSIQAILSHRWLCVAAQTIFVHMCFAKLCVPIFNIGSTLFLSFAICYALFDCPNMLTAFCVHCTYMWTEQQSRIHCNNIHELDLSFVSSTLNIIKSKYVRDFGVTRSSTSRFTVWLFLWIVCFYFLLDRFVTIFCFTIFTQ